jgi:hypothetical protein
MRIRWLADVVVRVVVDGELRLLYQGVEIDVYEENEYLKGAIANGLAEIIEE